MVELFDSLSARTRFAHFGAVFTTFCSQPEAASDVISGMFVGLIVLDKLLKFHGHSLSHSREIPPEAVGGGIFDSFFHYTFWPEVDNGVISGVAVDNVGVNVHVKFI